MRQVRESENAIFAVQRRETYHWNLDWEKYIVLVKSLVMLIPNYTKICRGKERVRTIYIEKFCITIFLNSLSDMFIFACISLAASSPTVYLNCGLSVVTACNITETCSDDEACSIRELK